MKSQSFRRTSQEGFRKIDHDFEFLLDCAREVLTEIRQPAAARLMKRPPPSLNGRMSRIQVQALSLAFQLLNLVEENVSNQTTRHREVTGSQTAEPGMWGDWFRRLRLAGVSRSQFGRALREVSVEAVLTGHPTEARRWSVLGLQRRLYMLLVQLENQMFTPSERQGIRQSIKTTLELLWRTGEILLNKPLVETERDNIIHYLTEKFPPALELVDRHYFDASRKSGYAVRKNGTEVLPRFRLGNWVGGDRDGHPFVTAAFTAETLADMRRRALEAFAVRLAELRRSMALSVFAQSPPEGLLDHLAEEFPGYAESASAREEPWGALVELMMLRLPNRSDAISPYRNASELREDLLRLERLLRKVDAGRLAEYFVRPEIRFLDTFGFHLASLDIRQNSAFHDRALEQLLVTAGITDGACFSTWSEDRKVAFLAKELEVQRPFSHPGVPLAAEAREAVGSLRVVGQHIRRHGRCGIGALIISMTRSLSDLLVAYALCREAGLIRLSEKGPVCLIRITPLFETLDDLERCFDILASFVDFPLTRASLPWLDSSVDDQFSGDATDFSVIRGDRLSSVPVVETMLGYSDSSKDGGILASQWAVYRTQHRLVELGRRKGVGFRFFHGRGGTVSRGAGPTHRFLEALPAGSLRYGTRVTEQGEVIAQKYNNHLTAAHNLELLLAGSLGASLLAEGREYPEELGRAMDRLHESSCRTYSALLETDGFVDFFRHATPIDALENSAIGSRPSRRSGQSGLRDLRAIPWVFSWNQSRFFLPGWYGVGSALEELCGSDPSLYRLMSENWMNWPFLRYLLYNIESSLESASVEWMKAYGRLVPGKTLRTFFLKQIVGEYDATRRHLETIMGDPLRTRRPRFFKTLHYRDEWLSLLHAEQIRRLRRWRQSGDKEDLVDVLQSINAVAAGLRTTG